MSQALQRLLWAGMSQELEERQSNVQRNKKEPMATVPHTAPKKVSRVEMNTKKGLQFVITGKKRIQESDLVTSNYYYTRVLAKKTKGRMHVGTNARGTLVDVSYPGLVYVINFNCQ